MRARNVSSLLTTIAFVAALVALAGCGSQTRVVRERLDELSGTTVLAGVEPMVFARTQPQYSRSGRDYLYLGPVETNRQGVHEYYVWVGVATTLDRGYLVPPAGEPERVFIDVAGEPMELVLRPWREREPGLHDARVYGTPVRLGAELAARVTLDQITKLAGEPLLSVRVVDRDGATREYYRWHEGSDWPAFLAAVGAGGH
ncbi:MAG TPA: hypothetical protein VMV37_09530 [Gammaproteobacteria bacterium]|nr:hypothetical protein [Gammaproteobacteria bacterium]